MRSSKRQQIIEEGARLFGTKGYSRTSMRDLAEAADMLPGSLYAHFSGKEDLLHTIVDVANTRLLDEARPLLEAEETAIGRLRAFCRGHMRGMAHSAHLHIVLLNAYRELDDDGRALIVKKRDEYESIPRQIVKDCVDEGVFAPDTDCAMATLTLLGMLNWTYHWYDSNGRLSADEIGDYFCQVMVSGHSPGS